MPNARSILWRRRTAGAVLILHGLAHSLGGMRATAHFEWPLSVAWAMALTGFLAAGLGLLGTPAFRTRWRTFTAVGLAGSACVLVFGWLTPLALPGLVIDLALLGVLLTPPRDGVLGEEPPAPARRRGAGGIILVSLAAALVLARPWHMRWGSTDDELATALPGDELAPDPRYLIQHAVTINAPPDSVWAWLAQAGGWRMVTAEPGRALFLDQWGAFVLEPEAEGRTRLIVRTRGSGEDRLRDLFLAPLGLILGEPAHFIMERGMLLRLRRLASHAG